MSIDWQQLSAVASECAHSPVIWFLVFLAILTSGMALRGFTGFVLVTMAWCLLVVGAAIGTGIVRAGWS